MDRQHLFFSSLALFYCKYITPHLQCYYDVMYGAEEMGYTNFNMRLDDDLRANAYPVLEQYGLTPSQAVRMFFNQIANTGKVPLSLDWAGKAPNKATLEAMKELENGGGTKYRTVAEAVREMQKLADGRHE
jgi:addiction module antitoxin, relB/dinJ family